MRSMGSPATIEVSPSTGLRRKQWVTVTGTAFGAEGRKVGVREHLCYDLVQDTGVILDRLGQPGNSFGYAEYFGDPAASLGFAAK